MRSPAAGTSSTMGRSPPAKASSSRSPSTSVPLTRQPCSRALAGTLTDAEQRAFAGNMLLEMARMSVDDGPVMTVHPGVYRNHNTDTFTRFGPDTGHDIPATST
jgi:hypothetical protein